MNSASTTAAGPLWNPDFNRRSNQTDRSNDHPMEIDPMTRRLPLLRLSTILAICLLPAVAHAHPGHIAEGSSLMSGLTHPLFGWDHLLAMLVIGLLAGARGGRDVAMLPIAFIAALVVGFIAAVSWSAPAVTEMAVALSLVGLGALLVIGRKIPLLIMASVAAFAGLFHGMAHGSEVACDATLFAVGFIISTFALHGAGFIAGKTLSAHGPVGSRILGTGTIMAGLSLAFIG